MGKETEKNSLLDEINSRVDLVRGSLNQVYRRCGNPRCRCARGEKHGPFYLLTWNEDGKTRSRYIPRGKVAELEGMIRNYHEVKGLLNDLSRVNLEHLLDRGRTVK